MDIKKSQRLSQYLGVISDLVQYSEIGQYMVEKGTLSVDEHELLQNKMKKEGNAFTMNEFLTMINLRRGGFDDFIQVLRSTDYVWIAEQLDPGQLFTEPTLSCTVTKRGSNATLQNLIANVRQTMNGRKSDHNAVSSGSMNLEEFTCMTYRGSCPFEIPNNQDANNKAKFCSKVERTGESSTSSELPVVVQLLNLDLDNGEMAGNIALVENVPESLTASPTEYFTKLAKRLDIPANLKVFCDRKISKTGRKRKHKVKNIKLEFHTENERNSFITSFQQLKLNMEPSDEFYQTAKQLNISAPTFRPRGGIFKSRSRKHDKLSVSKNSSRSTATKKQQSEFNEKPSKKHWYQQRLCLKSWKKEKDPTAK